MHKFLALFLLLTFIGCKREEEKVMPLPPDHQPEIVENPEISSFSINGIDFTIQDDLITGSSEDELENKSELVAAFEAEGTVKVNGIEQVSGVTTNDFTGPVVYSVTNSAGTTKEYTVKFPTFTGLARLFITIDERAQITKQDYVQASFKLDPNHQFNSDLIEVDGRIRGRGNSTWNMPKKPYRIKLDSKTSLFNMPAHKDWVLLANYHDKTLIRNYLAYRLAYKVETPFPPSYHFIEVFINGIHQGNYMLTDQTEVGSSRVDIPELKPSDDDERLITGGYLLEIDQRVLTNRDKPYFESKEFPIAIRSPDEPSDLQMEYITNYVKEAEDALFGENFSDVNNGFRKYFDEESMIRWFIVSEVFKNVDSRHFSSIFFHKDRGGKLTMGPIWDFDMSAGNARHCGGCMIPTGWYVKNHAWFNRMYEDPAFKAKVRSVFNQYKTEINDLLPEISKMTAYLDLSQKRNIEIWPITGDVGPRGPKEPTFESHVEFLKNFLSERIQWMDGEINN